MTIFNFLFGVFLLYYDSDSWTETGKGPGWKQARQLQEGLSLDTQYKLDQINYHGASDLLFKVQILTLIRLKI